MHILALPLDALYHIFKFLLCDDLCSMSLTCRTLRQVCLDDVLWRQIPTEIPLDVPLGRTLQDISGEDLRKLYIKEARLRKFWMNDEFIPVRVTHIPCPVSVLFMRAISSQWLLTLSVRDNVLNGAVIELWSLKDLDNIHVMCSIDTRIQFCSGFATAWQKDGKEILVAAYFFGSKIRAYSLILDDGVWTSRMIIALDGVLTNYMGGIYVVEHMIACCAKEGGHTTILLINSITKRAFSTKVLAFDATPGPVQAVLRLSPDLRYFVLLVGHCNSRNKSPEQLIHVYNIPYATLETTSSPTPKRVDILPTMFEHFQPTLETFYQSPHFDVSLVDPSVTSTSISLNPEGFLYIFQPEIEGTGAHITEFRIDLTVHLIRSQCIAPKLECSTSWPSLNFQCDSGGRGFFGASERLPNGNVRHQLYRTMLSHDGEAGAVVRAPLETLSAVYPPLAISYDDASGRLFKAIFTSDDFGATGYGMEIVDLV